MDGAQPDMGNPLESEIGVTHVWLRLARSLVTIHRRRPKAVHLRSTYSDEQDGRELKTGSKSAFPELPLSFP